MFWYWLNIYYAAVLFELNLIHISRRYGQGKWFDKMFAPIFEDILTLKLINEYHLTHSTIVIVNLIDIWGRYEPPMVQVVEHDHSHEEIGSMGSRCLTSRKILAEVYGTVPMYITHNLISP